MNHAIVRSNALAGLLLFSSVGSLAVTLGPLRGAALVGRTLDLSLLARLDAGEDPASLCTEAELAYSDTRIDARKLTVRTTATGEAGQALIRVTSSAIVDEPVVSLTLRAGCKSRSMRRYVLLADLPQESSDKAVAPLPLVPPVAAAGNPLATESVMRPISPVTGAPGPGTAGSGAREAAAETQPAVRAIRRPRATASATSTPGNRATSGRDGATSRSGSSALAQSLRLGESSRRVPGTPRLQLDSAELSAEVMPSLKSSGQLQTLPSEADPRRSEFAALWRALNLRPEEVSRDMQRLAELQGQARSLREANSKNDAALAVTREQLKKAESERYANPLVFGLVALLAALLMAAAYFYYRLNRSGASAAWWDLRDAEAQAEAESARAGRQAPSSVHEPDSLPPQPQGKPESLSSPVQESQRKVVRLDDTSQLHIRNGDSTYPPSGLSANPRGVNVNELFDIAQQAEFFVSLGQHDHAIEVLSNHIRENARTSPLAYLDLFRLYHDLDRKAQYEDLRLEFNRTFNAEVPAFESFRERGEGLEAYEGAMSRIQSLWNTPRVLDVIEESIFRKPGRPDDAFGLEAYRELLLLYAIANEIAETPRKLVSNGAGVSGLPRSVVLPSAPGSDRVVGYPSTELQPLGASAVYVRSDAAASGSDATSTIRRSGAVRLDIDLSDASLGESAFATDDTVVVPSSRAKAAAPAAEPRSSAWLDFDLSEIGPDSLDAGGASGGSDQLPRK
ncbi:MAG: hypothetical protein B7X59_04315 [Polaromonas sp. 39-63-203]|jgi:hypothetical protein|uniref:type IV pilus assembly protein FimV n=1 Tax=Polaromonas sp. TaxID=1869339 RepID=UPI000BCE5E45|nr:hypothetical protein [Polaromonas sp.]OYY53119.1 MAG: hypothetical protein B7Y54_04280 [Polaromonas sp. 35-63-240]OYZ84130.1 MAG: hypothetical protein B7Y03_05475 [Polaromonas sp. 24-62-144]OZA99100.1 MAG: hypothetical protein B7X59_04315 [Polaromonas sp. 39-63-203]HQS31320.1 hypothetical protein [Polaromonas sp.]HQS90262.1 hypothetical protein [Polaromonas sp.]